MVKLGKVFSIFAVLTLLILLAPAVILAPGGNVAAQGEEVTQELNATFSFTETEPGDWWTFTAGSGGIQGAGLTLEQYTRPYVLRGMSSPLAGCGFRNYTTGSGTVAGDLSGTMSLEWNTFRFNQTYSHTPIYMTATDFGFMTGRGLIDEGGGDNFTFVFVADLDCDDDMTNAEGKGFMVSVEENGIFGNMSLPVEQRHKIIGDFEVVKTGAAYTWDLHLRNYPPNEVEYKGNVTVEGYVMQEFTDPIHAPLALLNFSAGGYDVTPLDKATGFEEINWGKDPTKTVTGGPLGANGTMDITRNGALYLATPSGAVHIQAAEACILHIDDTYAQTAPDNSSYGHTYYYLLLTLPYQDLPIGDMFSQDGYTFCPFGLYLAPTDCYVGAETFALAHIEIMSAIGDAYQTSTDLSYGLDPHPQVSSHSIVPNTGSPGATISAVTITGKYFLRAAGKKSGWVDDSGSVDFGPNITVNSYTVDSANQITANITIAGDAAPGKRNVTVTSCFGYSNGKGAPPYKSGTLVDGFEVVTAGASLDGHVDLLGNFATNVTVRLFAEGTTTEAAKAYGTTDASGNFTISGLLPGTWDVGVKGQTSLSNLVTGVDLSVPGRTDFGVLVEGDASGDDYINPSDFAMLSFAWLSYPGHANWNSNADFRRDSYINPSDFALVSFAWLDWGACYGWPGNWN